MSRTHPDPSPASREPEHSLDLADVVLPLIRTRSDLHLWRAANAHGEQMHDAVDILESAVATSDPAEAYAVTHKALASAVKVIARADDSSGIIGDACHRLLDLHPRVAAAAGVPASKLVDWMVKFQFHGDVDFFNLDPVAYAPALGEAGVTSFRARLDEIRERLGPTPAEGVRASGAGWHARWSLEWMGRRLAVLDRDVEAIIRTHSRDRSVAAWFTDTAEALVEIGEFDLAIEWAEQATFFNRGHQSIRAADYWCELLHVHAPEQEVVARQRVFQRWPTSSTAAVLHNAAGKDWPSYQDEVMVTLRADPREAVQFTLGTLKDVRHAWDLAHSLDLIDGDAWDALAKAYAKVDPMAVLPIHRMLVEQELLNTGPKYYQWAARRLSTMRRLAAGTAQAAGVEELISELRQTNRRRPRLQQEFDRPGLP